MRWRQFLTPVKSISSEEARSLLAGNPDVQILDVRQPGEYEASHISGARLLPLGDLSERLGELDPSKTIIVYCAVGGRSRVAAQMLSGRGFESIHNLTGGIKAWDGWTGFGEYEQGLELFADAGNVEEVLAVAYGMEKALGEFYSQMAETVENDDAARLFRNLAAIEEKHRMAVAERYIHTVGTPPPEPESVSVPEGGVSTEEYMHRLGTNTESAQDVVAFAMALEAQAMDLYSRAAERAPDALSRTALEQIALEELGHLKQLSKVMDTLV